MPTRPTSKPANRFSRPEWITAGLAATALVVSTSITSLFTYWAAQSALDGKLVEIGISILAAEPSKTDVSPARDWAMRLVGKHSGEQFSEAEKEALRKMPIATNCFTMDWNADFLKCKDLGLPPKPAPH